MFKRNQINSSFHFYLSSVAFNVLGSALFDISAVIYVYQKSENNPLSIALYMLAMALPTIVLPPIGGALGSKFSRKAIIVITEISIAFLSMIMFIYPESSYIYFLALLMSSINVLAGPSRGSYVPDLVNSDKLLKANTLVQSSSSLANIIGVLLAGSLVKFSNPVYGFLLHSLCFIISGILIAFSRPKVNYQKSLVKDNTQKINTILDRIIKSIIELLKLRTAFRISLTLGIVLGISGVINVLYLVFLTEKLHVDESLYSILMLIESAGLFLGSILIGFIKRYFGSWNILFTAVIVDGICIASHLLIQNIYLFFFIGLITGIVGAMIFITSSTLLQKAIEENRRARLMGAHQTVIGFFSIPGLLLGGIIQNFIEIRYIFFICGVSIVIVGLTYLFLIGRGTKQRQTESREFYIEE